jgi:hypothetical protein
VQASYFLGGYISSIASGGVDLMREPLAVGVGSSAEPIHITVRNDFGEIDCTVNSVVAEPSTPDMQFYLMHSPVVFAIPDGPRGATPLQATFFGGRPVQISNLAPGTYHVIALDSFRDLNSVDPQELAKLIAQGKTVTVAPGGTVNVQLDLIKSGSEGLNP